MARLPMIYADFQNADADGYVRLNCDGTRADLEQARLVLAEGMRLNLSDGELQTEATVVRPGSEGVWRAEINWSALTE